MKYIILMIPFLIVSCASGPKSKTKNMDNIKQEDFKKVKMVKYRKADDYFDKVESAYSEASNSESLQRIFVYDGDITLEGDLGRVAKLCYEKNFTESEALIKQINQKYLKNPIFWNQVGTCHLLQNQRRKALLFYNKALAIKNNYAPSLNNLGVMYVYESDYSRALVAFKKAKKAKAFSRTPRINLANLYINFGLFDKAISELNALYNVSKKDIDILNLLGTAHLMQNDVSKSLSYFSKIDKDFFEDPRFGINYALSLYANGKEEDARDILDDIEFKNLRNWKSYFEEVKNYIGVRK